MKVSFQKFFCYCAHIQEILIVFIGRKHVVNPVDQNGIDLVGKIIGITKPPPKEGAVV